MPGADIDVIVGKYLKVAAGMMPIFCWLPPKKGDNKAFSHVAAVVGDRFCKQIVRVFCGKHCTAFWVLTNG